MEDIPNYGVIMPQVKILFEKSKSEKVEMALDFGLRKWVLIDETGKELKRYALTKYELLRFAHCIFPNDEMITNLYNASTK